MRPAAAALTVVLLALSGCTAGTAATRPGSPAALSVGGADLGNDRPQVSYDGLMVRRRLVIAARTTVDADPAEIRRDLDLVAAAHGTRLLPLSAGVLGAAVLEALAPDLVLGLPEGATRADAQALLSPASAPASAIMAEVQAYDILPVLVHDLRFTVSVDDPTALAAAITREGVLSDALGDYGTAVGVHRLDITYTGPLLSDSLVESVRRGMARRAGTTATEVAVAPGSTAGVGVDLSAEPAPAPAPKHAVPRHTHGAALPTQ